MGVKVTGVASVFGAEGRRMGMGEADMTIIRKRSWIAMPKPVAASRRSGRDLKEIFGRFERMYSRCRCFVFSAPVPAARYILLSLGTLWGTLHIHPMIKNTTPSIAQTINLVSRLFFFSELA